MTTPLVRRTLSNAGVLTLGQVTEAFLQFLFLLLVSRELGPADYGFVEYLSGIITFLLAIAGWGLPVVAVRELARRPERLPVVFPAMFRIRGVLSLLFVLGGIAAAAFGTETGGRATAVWVIFLYLSFTPFDLASIFDAQKLSRWDVVGRLTGRVISVGMLYLIWITTGDLKIWHAALSISLNLGINVTVAWRVSRRAGAYPGSPWRGGDEVTAETKRLLRVAAPIMWATLVTTVYAFSQTVLVKWYSTDVQTGFFGLANRLMFPLIMLKGVLYRLLLPLLSEVSEDRGTFEWRFGRVLTTLALFFMPLSALAIPVVEWLMVPVFGAQYAGSVLPMQILLGHLFVSGVSSIFATAVFSLGYQKSYTWSLTIACAVNLAAAALLIPQYGAVGAAIAVALAELLAPLLNLPVFLKVTKVHVWGRVMRIAGMSLAGLATYFLLTRILSVSAILATAADGAVIAALLWITGEISVERIRGIVDLVRKERQQDE